MRLRKKMIQDLFEGKRQLEGEYVMILDLVDVWVVVVVVVLLLLLVVVVVVVVAVVVAAAAVVVVVVVVAEIEPELEPHHKVTKSNIQNICKSYCYSTLVCNFHWRLSKDLFLSHQIIFIKWNQTKSSQTLSIYLSISICSSSKLVTLGPSHW